MSPSKVVLLASFAFAYLLLIPSAARVQYQFGIDRSGTEPNGAVRKRFSC